MAREAIILVGVSVVFGFSCFYWKNEPSWCVPQLPILINVAVLYLIASSWTRKTEDGVNVVISLLKISLWIGSICYMVIVIGFIEAWKLGIIKYACMQEVTTEMQVARKEHANFIHGPITSISIELSSLLIALNLVLIVVAITFGKRSGKRIVWFLGRWKNRPILYSLIVLVTISVIKPAVYFLELWSICVLPFVLR